MQTTQAVRNMDKSRALCTAAARLLSLHDRTWRDDAGARPPVLVKGRGSVVTDADGNEYIDFDAAGGALILGHADERVVVAVNKAMSKGVDLGRPTEAEVRLAELTLSRFPGVDRVCFVLTDRDALDRALRLARLVTGKKRILFAGECRMDGTETSRIPINDAARLRASWTARPEAPAALVVEPAAARAGLTETIPAFLETARECCDASGALLIYNESFTALRVRPGGSAPLGTPYPVHPDLTVLGTALGGGLPLAALAGRREWMEQLCSLPSQQNEPAPGLQLSLAAGIATLQALGEPGVYETLDARAAQLDAGLREAAGAAGLPCRHLRVASLVGMFAEQTGAPHRRGNTPKTAPFTSRFASFYEAMLDHGVLWPPCPAAPLCVSAAHTDDQIGLTIEAAREALRRID